jgi:hydrogenase/urease accessory protein HupE
MFRNARRVGWVLGLSLGALPGKAHAHAEPYSWVDLRLEAGGWTGQVTAHVVDLAHEAGLASVDSLLDPDFVTRHEAMLQAAVETRLHLQADGMAVTPLWRGCSPVPERQAVALSFEPANASRPGRIVLRGPLFDWEAFHQTYFNVYDAGVLRHQDMLDQRHPSSTFTDASSMSRSRTIARFVAAGVHHIFIGPDHILFIVGLLLLGGSVRQLLGIVTSFTLAHSATLALAATGLVTPPARLVEPTIALSIVYVGAANLLAGSRAAAGRRDRRSLIAACFGLVHGFGFASVLRELGLPREALAWSLLSFNVGVEIGQACVVLAVAPLLALLRARRPAWAVRAVTAGSFVVVAAGTYWFVRRAFFV